MLAHSRVPRNPAVFLVFLVTASESMGLGKDRSVGRLHKIGEESSKIGPLGAPFLPSLFSAIWSDSLGSFRTQLDGSMDAYVEHGLQIPKLSTLAYRHPCAQGTNCVFMILSSKTKIPCSVFGFSRFAVVRPRISAAALIANDP
jgi:hypothetical protein